MSVPKTGAFELVAMVVEVSGKAVDEILAGGIAVVEL